MTPGARWVMILPLLLGLAAGHGECEDWKGILRENTGIELPLEGDFLFRGENSSEDGGHTFTFKKGTDLLWIRSYSGMTNEGAQKLRDDRVFLLDNLFIVQPSPYADALSRLVGSPEECAPTKFQRESDGLWLTAYSIKANMRYIYGESIDENNCFVSAYILCYCATCRIFNEIKYFTPRLHPLALPERVINGVRCCRPR